MVRNIDIIFLEGFYNCDIGRFIDHATDTLMWVMIPGHYITRYILHKRYERKLERKGIPTEMLDLMYNDRVSTFKLCAVLNLI